MSSPLLDRIFSAGMEGMTLHETNHCETKSLKNAIASNRIKSILRTGRLKSACSAEQRRNHDAVALNDVQTQTPHLNSTRPWSKKVNTLQ